MGGVLAMLARITGVPAAGVAEAIAAVLAAVLALAAAALAGAALGHDRRRFALTVILTGSFLSLMVSGYLSTLAFGVCFVAALAVAAERIERLDRRALAGVALLVAAAGLAHLLFLALAAAVAAGVVVALLPAARRDLTDGRPVERTAAARFAAAMTAGAGLAVAGFLAVGSGPPAPETSRDAILRRAGLRSALVNPYRRKLLHDFPWFRAATVVGLAATPLAVSPARSLKGIRRRWFGSDDLRAVVFWGVVATWLLVTVGAVIALALGIGAPGQRLAAFCVPLPILAAVGLSRLASRQKLLAAAGAVLFVVVAHLAWGGQHPLIKNVAVEEARAAGAALGRTPPGTPLVLVVDDRGDKPALFITRYANNLRDAVPAARVPDVHLFVGTPASYLRRLPSVTGQREHDTMALTSWADIRSIPRGRALAVAIEGFDPDTFDQALALPGAKLLAPGVVALPGNAGPPCGSACPRNPAMAEPGSGLLSPWLPVWLAPLLLVVFGLLGLPWAGLALDRAEPILRVALAPAFGLAALSLASVLTDVAGLRLSGAGGWVALALAAGGWLLSPLLRAREGASEPRPRDRQPR